MSHTRLTLRLERDLSQINRLTALFEEAFCDYRVPQDDQYAVLLVLDEVVSNVIRHGAVEGRRLRISVGSTLSDVGVRLHVVDDGKPFDPLQHIYEAPRKPDAVRPGGWGIHLVKVLMDSVRYRRRGSFNCLTLSKSFAKFQQARA